MNIKYYKIYNIIIYINTSFGFSLILVQNKGVGKGIVYMGIC